MTWDELADVSKQVFMSCPDENAWATPAIAMRHLQIYLAHEVAGWTYDQIQEAEADVAPVGTYSMIVSRFRTISKRPRIAEQIRREILFS